MAVHAEWIYPRFFDEKFKNALRDYYSYGFKNYDSYGVQHGQILVEDWKRLNNILGDYLEWSEDPNQVMFASLDSQAEKENVFQRVIGSVAFWRRIRRTFFTRWPPCLQIFFCGKGFRRWSWRNRTDWFVPEGRKFGESLTFGGRIRISGCA